jgi:hypothetical protein
MWHLYWHQGEAGNRGKSGLFAARHRERQSPRLSYGIESVDREKGCGRREPNFVGPTASRESQFRLKRPERLSAARLFFNAGPVDFDPLLDSLLVPLDGLSLGFLWTPAHRMKQAPDVIDMVSDTKNRLNQFSHSRTCPKICVETSRFGSSKKMPFQIFFGLFIKFWRTARRWLCPNSLGPLASESGLPTADTSTVYFDLIGDFDRLESIFQKIHSFESTAFQCFWASGRL